MREAVTVELQLTLVELETDLIAAIKEAAHQGKVNSRDFEVTFLYYWEGLTFEEIADGLEISADAVRRSHKKMLRALRGTGLLEGYGTGE